MQVPTPPVSPLVRWYLAGAGGLPWLLGNQQALIVQAGLRHPLGASLGLGTLLGSLFLPALLVPFGVLAVGLLVLGGWNRLACLLSRRAGFRVLVVMPYRGPLAPWLMSRRGLDPALVGREGLDLHLGADVPYLGPDGVERYHADLAADLLRLAELARLGLAPGGLLLNTFNRRALAALEAAFPGQVRRFSGVALLEEVCWMYRKRALAMLQRELFGRALGTGDRSPVACWDVGVVPPLSPPAPLPP